MANGLSNNLAQAALLGKQDQSLMDTAVSAGVPQETLGLMFNALAGPNVNYDTQSGILTTRGPQRQGTIDMSAIGDLSQIPSQQQFAQDLNMMGATPMPVQETAQQPVQPVTQNQEQFMNGGVQMPTGYGTVLKSPSQVMMGAGVPTMEENVAGMMSSTPGTAPTLSEGVQPGSPQANFLSMQASGQQLGPERIAQAEQFAASMGTTFDPETGYSREPFLQAQEQQAQAEAQRQTSLAGPLPGQSLSQFMRYEDQPIQRTEQFVDKQGRIRRRATDAAVELMRQDGFDIPQGVQPLAPEFAGFEQESAAREARIAARPDFMVAQPDSSRAGQTMSFSEAKRQAEATLVSRGIRNPTAQQVNTVARALQDQSVPTPEAVDPLDRRLKEIEVLQAEQALTGDPLERASALLDLQLKQKDLAQADPDKLGEAMNMADRLGLQGQEREDLIMDQIRKFSPQPGVAITLPGEQVPAIDPVMLRQSISSDEKVFDEKIRPAITSLGTVDKMLKLLDSGEVITGAVAKPELYIKAVAKDFGVGEFPDVATTQEYIANAGRQVGQVITLFGAGTGLSDKDREFAEKIAGGDISVPRKALKRIVTAARDTIERETKAYDARIKRRYSASSGLTPQQQAFALNSLSIENLSELFPNGTTQPTPTGNLTQDAKRQRLEELRRKKQQSQ